MTTTLTYNTCPGEYQLFFHTSDKGPHLILWQHTIYWRPIRPEGSRFDWCEWGVKLSEFGFDFNFDLPAIHLGSPGGITKLQAWKGANGIVFEVHFTNRPIWRWEITKDGCRSVPLDIAPELEAARNAYKSESAPKWAGNAPDLATASQTAETDLETEIRATIREWINEETLKVRDRIHALIIEELKKDLK